MSQDNQITLRGYLTAEPKLYQKTATAVPVTEIRIGSTPRRLNRETGEWQSLPTSYYRVKCWRRLAVNAVSSLHKGDMVVVRGWFYMNEWVDSQQRPRATIEIEADSLGHDLAYGWSHFLRGSRPQGNAADAGAGEAARQDTGLPDPGASDHEFGPAIDADEPADGALDPVGQADAEYAAVSGGPLAAGGEDGDPATEGAGLAPGLSGDAVLAEAGTRTEDAVVF
jgi:single-strand DNA-binding protein